jgi:hypothetical protein
MMSNPGNRLTGIAQDPLTLSLSPWGEGTPSRRARRNSLSAWGEGWGEGVLRSIQPEFA